ncbi:MAG: chemotaxis protein CheW [Candidatus Sedimenticola sp. (ex Thyasira tokunagai)]
MMNDSRGHDDGGQNIPESAEVAQYLTLTTGDEQFAIGISGVKEIIEVTTVTRVPMVPDFIRGVINLRGNVVPVVDLSVRLGRRRSILTKRSCIILVEIETAEHRQLLGMLVDSVNEILEIAQSDIKAPPSFGADIRTDFIERMGRVGDHFIILLSVSNVLSVAELALLDKLVRGDLDTSGEQELIGS